MVLYHKKNPAISIFQQKVPQVVAEIPGCTNSLGIKNWNILILNLTKGIFRNIFNMS
jgi:hypothetical protein